MKSIDMNAQEEEGTGNGCNRPEYLARYGLDYKHVWQCWTYSQMSRFMPTQKNNCLILDNVAREPECPPSRLECKADIT